MSDLKQDLENTKKLLLERELQYQKDLGIFLDTIDLAQIVIDGLNENGNMKLNPDDNHVEKILEALEKNDGFCPCRAEKNKDTVCPCKKMREENKCCCKLYVMR